MSRKAMSMIVAAVFWASPTQAEQAESPCSRPDVLRTAMDVYRELVLAEMGVTKEEFEFHKHKYPEEHARFFERTTFANVHDIQPEPQHCLPPVNGISQCRPDYPLLPVEPVTGWPKVCQADAIDKYDSSFNHVFSYTVDMAEDGAYIVRGEAIW